MNKIKSLLYNYVIPVTGRVYKKKNSYINVIYYHDIVRGDAHGCQYMNVDTFKAQMEYLLKNGYKTYTFDQLEKEDCLCFHPKSVLITFDDGWRSNYDEIFAYMKEKQLKYNIFLVADKIGKHEKYLDWDMVRQMYASGVVGFGAHTVRHVSMADPQMENYDFEINEANRIIEKELGFVPRDFCYPYGCYSTASNQYLVNNSVYKRIYTSDLRFSYPMEEKIIFGRNPINADESFRVYKNKVKGNYNAVSKILRR